MGKIHGTTDTEARMTYITLRDHTDGQVVKTWEVIEGLMNLDIAEGGDVIGIELFGVLDLKEIGGDSYTIDTEGLEL